MTRLLQPDVDPLVEVGGLLRHAIAAAARDCDAVVVLLDGAGLLTGVDGEASTVARARTAGLGRVVSGAAGWQVSAAVIQRPDGAALGTVLLCGSDRVRAPATVAVLVTAVAAAEAELARRAATRGSIRLHALDRDGCAVRLGSRLVELSPRHSELVILLAARPSGWSAARLAIALHERDVALSTVRGEFSRLQAILGAGVLRSRPYRFAMEVRGDWDVVLGLVRSGDLAGALRAYPGSLLPASDAPGVIELRDRIDRQVRAAVLASAEPALLGAWTRTAGGRADLTAYRALAERADRQSLTRVLAAAEVGHLQRESAGLG